MKKNPLVSIIIPVYNCKQYLGRCLDSLLKQNYDNFEIILIDDGSKDKSGSICDRYQKERYSFFSEQNEKEIIKRLNFEKLDITCIRKNQFVS